MKTLRIERLDNNYRIQITVDKVTDDIKPKSVIIIDDKPVKVLSIKEVNQPLSQFIIEAKEFAPCLYVWTTNTYRKENIYKIGIVNWQTISERMKQTYTTGVLEPIQVVDTWMLDLSNPSLTEKIETEIHNTIGLHTKGREAVKADYKKVIKPTIEKVIKKWTSEFFKEITTPSPRYFQSDAAELSGEYFKSNDRGYIQWTCGAGKSFGGYWIYESVFKNIKLQNNIVVVLVPNKQLVDQTGNDWKYISTAYGKRLRLLKVYSDECNNIETFLKTSTIDNINLIMATYQSSSKLAHYLKSLGITIDFLINDEVHRLTGSIDKSWSQCLFDSHLPARKRLSMTASPVEYTEKSLGYSGMENESLYGKRIHQYSFLDAQFDGYIAPLNIMGVELDGNIDWMVEYLLDKKDIIQQNLYGSVDMSQLEEEVNISKGNPAFFVQLHNTLSCLRDGVFTHPLIYANSTKRIEMFMACLKAMAPVYGVTIDYDAIFTSKNSTVSQRIIDLENKFSTSKIGVVGNIYCLQEGISINEVDAVVMVDPRSSAPAIIQILGRPVRLDSKNPNKVATILLPIIFNRTESGKVMIDGSYFDDIKDWIINLCVADEDMKNIITDMKFLSSKSREGIEVRSVVECGKKGSISGRNRDLDKKETTYETIDFNDVIFNSDVNVMISTKNSVERIKMTEVGIDMYLNRKAIDYMNNYKTKIEVALSRKYHKNHTNLIKDINDHISDFAQLSNVDISKSNELLSKYNLDGLKELTSKLQHKIILESL
jgi:predicted helicase